MPTKKIKLDAEPPSAGPYAPATSDKLSPSFAIEFASGEDGRGGWRITTNFVDRHELAQYLMGTGAVLMDMLAHRGYVTFPMMPPPESLDIENRYAFTADTTVIQDLWKLRRRWNVEREEAIIRAIQLAANLDHPAAS